MSISSEGLIPLTESILSTSAHDDRSYVLPEIRDDLKDTITKYRESLLNVAFRITNDSELAKDMVQDAYLSVMENSEQFRGSAALKTYIYRIVINKSIDSIRKTKRSKNLLESFYINKPNIPVNADRFEVKDLAKKLFTAIPDNYKVPFILAETEGMKYEEIADVLKISVNTVRTRIFRCRERLRKEYKKLGIIP